MRLIACAIAAALLTGLPAIGSAAACGDNQNGVRTQAQGQIERTATHLDIRSSFQSRADTPDKAMTALESRFAPVLEASRESDLGSGRVEADQVRIRPRFSHQDNGVRRVSGYSASRTITLARLPVEQAGHWIEQFAEAGVSNLSIENNRALTDEPIGAEALALAVESARDKAQAMAAALDQSIGDAMCIETLSRATAPARDRVMAASASAAPAPSIEPGQVSATARVEVVFALNPATRPATNKD